MNARQYDSHRKVQFVNSSHDSGVTIEEAARVRVHDKPHRMNLIPSWAQPGFLNYPAQFGDHFIAGVCADLKSPIIEDSNNVIFVPHVALNVPGDRPSDTRLRQIYSKKFVDKRALACPGIS